MKTIGLIGGMSWESSIEYYRIINETVQERLGGFHSARSIMYSVDFAQIEELQQAGRWDEAVIILVDAAERVERGGADVIVLCTNTMHKLADEIQRRVSFPLLHIADTTARAIQDQGLQRIGLLGTSYTMEEDFYKGRLTEAFDLDIVVPPADERAIVHQIIFDELCRGMIRQPSRERYRAIIDHLVEQGAEGVILGCTEIGLLIKAPDSPVPVFDTTYLHAVAAVDYALGAFSV